MSDGHCTNCGGVGSFRVPGTGYTDPDNGTDCEHDECYDCRGTGWARCPLCEERHDPEEATAMCANCGERVTCASLVDSDGDWVCEPCDEGPPDLPENDTYWVTR